MDGEKGRMKVPWKRYYSVECFLDGFELFEILRVSQYLHFSFLWRWSLGSIGSVLYSSYSQCLMNMETMRISKWMLYLLILTPFEKFTNIISYERKVQRYLNKGLKNDFLYQLQTCGHWNEPPCSSLGEKLPKKNQQVLYPH